MPPSQPRLFLRFSLSILFSAVLVVSACIVSTATSAEAATSPAGETSFGSWNGVGAVSGLYGWTFVQAGGGNSLGTGDCSFATSLDPSFQTGANAAVAQGRAFVPFWTIDSNMYAHNVCGFDYTPAQWGQVQADWLLYLLYVDGLTSKVNLLASDVEFTGNPEWSDDTATNNAQVIYGFNYTIAAYYNSFYVTGVYASQGTWQALFGGSDPYVFTSAVWEADWTYLQSVVDSTTGYWSSLGYTIAGWQYSAGTEGLGAECPTNFAFFSQAKALAYNAPANIYIVDKWTNSEPGILCTHVAGMVGNGTTNGYWLADQGGGIYNENATFDGSLPSVGAVVTTSGEIVGITRDPSTGGYWLVGRDGGVFAFNAPYYGSMGGQPLAAPIVGMAATPDGGGYWLVGSDGGIFAFGDAQYEQSCPSIGGCGTPIEGIAAYNGSPDAGYWLVGQDGGVFGFGAPYYGSLPGDGIVVNDIDDIAGTPSGNGYWLVGSDGGVFGFGGAGFHGSNPGISPCSVTSIAGTSDAGGYWLTDSLGNIYAYGDATYKGGPQGTADTNPGYNSGCPANLP